MNVVVLVGGPNSTFAETWEWDGTAWTQRQSNLPSPRLFHAMAHDPERHRTVLFGGAATGVEQADTWEWIGAQWVRQNVTGPSMRQAHAMTYDSQRNVSVLFGGATSAGQLYGDTWEYDGSWTQRATTGPSARYGHAMAFDAAHGQTVLFGGRLISLTPTTVFADTWTWNGASWSQRTVAGPAPRWGAGMAFDADRGNTVLFGGTSGTGATLRHFDDTWTWNGAAWSRQRVSGPSARYSQTMAFDPVRHVVVLFGGGTLASPYGADAWEWDGDMWSRRPDAGPVGRFGSAMVFDTTLGGVMIYGGGAVPPGVTSFTNIADTWGLAMTAERCPAPKIGLSPATRGVVCRGASQTLTLTGSGLPGLAYQWRRGTPGAALAGQTGATLTLPSIGASDADMYDCLVTTSCGVVTTNAVRLTMCAADVNCSATVDVTDIFDFLRLWFAGDSLGDFDGSGFLSIQDVFALINAWFVGC